jgi:hypothetical protein
MVNSYCSQQLLASIPLSEKRYAALATRSCTSARCLAPRLELVARLLLGPVTGPHRRRRPATAPTDRPIKANPSTPIRHVTSDQPSHSAGVGRGRQQKQSDRPLRRG